MRIYFNKNIPSDATGFYLHNFEFYTASSHIIFEFYAAVNTFDIDSMEKSLGISLAVALESRYFIYFRRNVCFI